MRSVEQNGSSRKQTSTICFTSNVWTFGHVAKHCLTSRISMQCLWKTSKMFSTCRNQISKRAMFCNVFRKHFFEKQISFTWQTMFDRLTRALIEYWSYYSGFITDVQKTSSIIVYACFQNFFKYLLASIKITHWVLACNRRRIWKKLKINSRREVKFWIRMKNRSKSIKVIFCCLDQRDQVRLEVLVCTFLLVLRLDICRRF